MDVYVTSAGETWDTIAYRLWGDEFRMTELMAANRSHLHVLVFAAGVELVVPNVQAGTVVEVPPPWA